MIKIVDGHGKIEGETELVLMELRVGVCKIFETIAEVEGSLEARRLAYEFADFAESVAEKMNKEIKEDLDKMDKEDLVKFILDHVGGNEEDE